MRAAVILGLVLLSAPAHADDATDVLLGRAEAKRYARTPLAPVIVRLHPDGKPLGKAPLYMPAVVAEVDGMLRVQDYDREVELLLYVDEAAFPKVVVANTTVAAGADGVGATLRAGRPVAIVGEGRLRYDDEDVWIEGAADPATIGVVYAPEELTKDFLFDALLKEGSELLDAPKGKAFAGIKAGGKAWPHHLRDDGQVEVKRLGSRKGHELVRYETDAAVIVGWVPKQSVRDWAPEPEDPEAGDGEEGVEGGVEGGVIGGVAGGCWSSEGDRPAVLPSDTLLYLTPGGPVVGATNGPVCSYDERGEVRDGYTAWRFETSWGELSLWVEGTVASPADETVEEQRHPPPPPEPVPTPVPPIDKASLAFPAIYRTLGREDLANAYDRRLAKKDKLKNAGMLFALSALNCAWYCPMLERDVAIGVTGGLVGVGALLYIWGAAIDPEPISRGELDALIDEHDRTLVPYLTPDGSGAGLAAVGSF